MIWNLAVGPMLQVVAVAKGGRNFVRLPLRMSLRESGELCVGNEVFVQVEGFKRDDVFRDGVGEELAAIDLEDGLETGNLRRVDAKRYRAAGNMDHVRWRRLVFRRRGIYAEQEKRGRAKRE